MAECGSAWLEWFAGYCLHSWLPHRLWQMTYCTLLCCAKLKIWLTVGHWPRVVTTSTIKTPWPLTICWWWKAMSPFLGVCSIRPMFTDVTGDVCNTLPTSSGEDGSKSICRYSSHAQKWSDIKHNLKVGDLILIMDENAPRGLWPLGLVLETSVGRDGLVRSVRLRTKCSVLMRPITNLVYLEGSDV